MLGQAASCSLILSEESYCQDRFAIYSFAKLWVSAGTRANHAAIGRLSFLPTGGGGGERVGHVRRHFWILLVDSRFSWGGFFKCIFFLGDENVFEKN